MDNIFIFLIIGVVIVAGVMIAISAIKSLIIIAPPNRAAVITGRKRSLENGEQVGYRVVIGGRTLRVPIIESVSWMSLDTLPLELNVHNAFSKGGIPLTIQAIANVKIASTPETVFNNAVERLLSKGVGEVEELATETLSANLRGVLASLTPEEVNEDRLKFSDKLIEEADHDLQKLGLQLDTLKIQNVSDDVGYLASVGKVKTAEVLRNAEVAKAQNESETRRQQAEARRSAEIAEAQSIQEIQVAKAESERLAMIAQARAQVDISTAENELRVRRAELGRQAETTEKVAKVAAEQAEIEARQALEQQRIELKKKSLQVDIIQPAEAERIAAEARAKAEAAPILEKGRAQAEVLRMMYAEIQAGGDQAYAVMMAEKLPALFGSAMEAMNDVRIDKLVVMDNGSGNGVGNAAGQKVNGSIQMMETLASNFGIDLDQVFRAGTKRLTNGSSRITEEPVITDTGKPTT